MASTWSSLKVQLMGAGDESGTWGTVTNANLGTVLEEAIAGSANVTFSGADVTLTLTNSTSSQSARNMRLNLTGTSGGARNLIVPAIEKLYVVNNGLADTVTVKNSSGTGIDVPSGKTMFVFNNATNVVDAITHLTSLTLGTPLPVAQGGTGSNTGVNLQSAVSGVLPVANGGTGSNTATFSGANITSLNASNISAGTLANARTTAASDNGASTIVARDASGNFSANTITANLTGTVTGSASLNVLSSAFTSTNQSLTANGYQKFPGGLIIQWGYEPDTGGTMNVSFPIAFPSACVCVNAQIRNTTQNYQSIAINAPTTTGFTLYWDSAPVGFYWFAIGY
jgi:hypothetical protein